MQSGWKATLAGAAALAGIGLASPALAGDGQPHLMTLRLPDGSIAQIPYTGDTPPQVAVVPVPVAVLPPGFFAPAGFGPSFASLDRLSAMMDRQMEMMMRQAAAMQQAAMGSTPVALPPGTHMYSVSSTIAGSGACMRSVQVTYNGTAKPQIVSHTAGNCGPSAAEGTPAEVNAPAPVVRPPTNRPRLIEVKANADRPLLALAHPADPQR